MSGTGNFGPRICYEDVSHHRALKDNYSISKKYNFFFFFILYVIQNILLLNFDTFRHFSAFTL